MSVRKITFLLFLSCWFLLGQELDKTEEFSRGYLKTVVETTMGCDTEGLGYRTWEGEPDYPISIVADSKMRIYVLDHLNNRIKVYSEDGKYLNDLKVKVYEEVSYEERKKHNLTAPLASLYGKEMFIGKDTLYIPVIGGFYVDTNWHKVIKVYSENDTSWVIEEVKEGELLKEGRFNEKISKVDGLEAEVNKIKELKIRDTKKGSEKIIELPHNMGKVYIDKEKNIYVVNIWGYSDEYPQLYGIVQKYSKEGELLRELKIPFSLDCPFVDKNGNVFAMQRVPERKEYGEYVNPGVIKITIWK
jgi:hypothetical protein